MPPTRQHIALAHHTGIPYVVVYLNKCDQGDEELVEILELETRELLTKYGFPGDDIAIIRGSALKALERLLMLRLQSIS